MPFLLDLRTKPITKLQSVNKSHHQTPICIETHHQTPISAIETHHQTSIQPLTITDPTTKQSCNPSPTDPNSNLCCHQNSTTDADHHKPHTLHHADPHKPTPSISPWQVGNTICIETHKKKIAKERDPLI